MHANYCSVFTWSIFFHRHCVSLHLSHSWSTLKSLLHKISRRKELLKEQTANRIKSESKTRFSTFSVLKRVRTPWERAKEHEMHSQYDKNQSYDREMILLRHNLIIRWPSAYPFKHAVNIWRNIFCECIFFPTMSSLTAEWLNVYLSLNILNDHKTPSLCIFIQHPWGKKNENKYSLLILYIEKWVPMLRKHSFFHKTWVFKTNYERFHFSRFSSIKSNTVLFVMISES